MNCFRFFDLRSLDEFDRMTLKEYGLRIEALKLKNVDKNFWTHWQAYLDFCAQAQKPAGKKKMTPVYKTFRRFFDYDREIYNAKHDKNKKESDRFKGIGDLL